MITIEKLFDGRNGRALGFALYAVCGLFLVSPALDLMAAVLPAKIGNIQWRFGLMVNVSPTIMTGAISLAMFAVLGLMFAHRRVLQSVGAISLVLALVYVGMMGVFALDLLQLRKAVPPDRQTAFMITSGKCMLQVMAGSVALLMLGLGSFWATRAKGNSATVEGGRGRGPMVLASRPSPDHPSGRPSEP